MLRAQTPAWATILIAALLLPGGVASADVAPGPVSAESVGASPAGSVGATAPPNGSTANETTGNDSTGPSVGDPDGPPDGSQGSGGAVLNGSDDPTNLTNRTVEDVEHVGNGTYELEYSSDSTGSGGSTDGGSGGGSTESGTGTPGSVGTTSVMTETDLSQSSRVDWTVDFASESYDLNPTFDADGNLYVAANGPSIRRVDYETGSTTWEFAPNVPSYVVHGPEVEGGTVYATTSTFEDVPGEAHLYALDAATGNQQLDVNLTADHGPVNVWRGIETDANGNVYVVLGRASTDFGELTPRYLVSYDSNGNLRWNTTLWDGFRRPRFVTVDNGQVTLSGQYAVTVDTATGNVTRNVSTPYGSLVSTPRVDDGVFYEASYETNTLYAVYASNLTTKWTLNASQYANGSAWGVPVPGNGDNVYWFANPSAQANPGDESATDMVVIDEDDGSVKRTVNLTMDAPAKAEPFVRQDERIYVLTNDNELIAANETSQLYEITAPSNSGEFQAGFTPPEYGPHGRLYFGYTPDFGGTTTLVALNADPVLLNDRVAYEGKSTQDLRSINASGDVIVYNTTGGIAQFGPVFEFVDGDDQIEVPYVDNNGDLNLVDRVGEVEQIDTDVDAERLGVGDLDGDGNTGVIYIRKGDIFVTEGNPNGTVDTRQINDGGASVTGVTGITDFNNDGTPDVVFISKSSSVYEVRYVQNGQVFDTGAATDSSTAISTPADFDNDGDIEVAVEAPNTKDAFNLVDENGLEETYNQPVASGAMGALDVSGDGVPDVVFVENKRIKYYDVINGTTGEINASERAKSSSGVT